MPDGPNGLVVIDKAAAWTSHDVVAKLRGQAANRANSVTVALEFCCPATTGRGISRIATSSSAALVRVAISGASLAISTRAFHVFPSGAE